MAAAPTTPHDHLEADGPVESATTPRLLAREDPRVPCQTRCLVIIIRQKANLRARPVGSDE